jgi:uncharacterized protein (TIGR02996 family)
VLFVALRAGERRRTYSFVDSYIIIGRGEDADVRLDRDGVADEHLRIAEQGTRTIITDLTTSTRRVVDASHVVELCGVELRFAVHETEFIALKDPVEQSLLDAIAANPNDAATRSIYADWLESVGGWAHAEFLRTQLALADARDATAPAFQAASQRLAELAARLEPAWRARVAIAFVEGCPAERARSSMWAFDIQDTTGATPQRRVLFDKPEVTFGSVPGNDIILGGADSRHARAVLKDGKYIVVDLRSGTGTYVNGRRINHPLVIKPTDRIYIADFAIAVGPMAADEWPAATRDATRIAMELVCPQRWDRLAPTAQASVRHCAACKRNVTYCTTVREAQSVASNGGCIAIDVREPRSSGDLNWERPQERRMMMGIPAPARRDTPPPPPRPTITDDFAEEEATTPQPPPRD